MRKKEIQKKQLSFTNYNLLIKIFDEKRWPKTTDEGETTFNDFCEMLSFFEKHEQELILKLTKDFLKIGISQYVSIFLDAFTKMLKNIDKDCKKIIIFPLKDHEKTDSTKSGSVIHYLLAGKKQILKKLAENVEIIFIDNYSALLSETKETDSIMLCLVDDFIGTGDSAKEIIERIPGEIKEKNEICLLSLVAQNEGVLALKEIEKEVFCSFLRYKGISENEQYTEKDIETMASIEQKIKVSKKFVFGYGHSEALVMLHKIPNNTFPVYWYSHNKAVRKVPFPRH